MCGWLYQSENDKVGEALPAIKKAAIRYANQQTQELQAQILSYRHHYVTSFNLGVYDQHFGISTDRYGNEPS